MDKELKTKRAAAIRLAHNAGEKMAREYPGIADDYRSGLSRREIEEKYGFGDIYGLSREAALTSICYALKTLIPEPEMDELGIDHVRGTGRKNGRNSYEACTGLFSLSDTELEKARKKGGRAAGIKSMDERLGLFSPSFTKAQLADAARDGVRARGLVPWSEEEKKYFAELCENPDYFRVSGPKTGLPNYEKIAAELFGKFGVSRNARALKNMRYKINAETLFVRVV